MAAEAAPTKASTVGAALTPGCRSPHPPCPARHTCAAPHRCRVRHTIAVRPRPASPGPAPRRGDTTRRRSEEHTSELQSLMRISYAVFCLKKKNHKPHKRTTAETDRTEP